MFFIVQPFFVEIPCDRRPVVVNLSILSLYFLLKIIAPNLRPEYFKGLLAAIQNNARLICMNILSSLAHYSSFLEAKPSSASAYFSSCDMLELITIFNSSFRWQNKNMFDRELNLSKNSHYHK